MSLKVVALLFGSSLIVFMISVPLDSRKVNISLLLNVFFNLRVFVKFVKYLFKACDIFFLTYYCVIFVEDDCVNGFTFIKEGRLHGLPKFVSVRNIFKI